MVKRIFAVALISLACSVNVYAADIPSVSAHSAALMVADTHELVYGKAEHTRRPMASTTKIMTALLTLRCATPYKEVTVTEKMAAVEGSSMGLMPGDKVTYHDLVYGMLLASGNDAANTAAISVAGSATEFAKLMNKTANEIGMTNTNFVTPSGLDAENHYSTAYDMALLGCVAIENPDFLAACSSVQAKLCYGNEPYTRYLSNHNRLLKSFDGAIGIKTGFTKKSGRCLVSAATRDGVTLVCATLNAPNDWQDHAELLEYGFSVISTKELSVEADSVAVWGGNAKKVSVSALQPIQINSFCSAEQMETQILLKPYTVAPVEKGQVIGEVRINVNGKTVKSIPLAADNSVTSTTQEIKPKKRLTVRIKAWLKCLIDRIINSFKER